MAKRDIPEINAGSMADIAFLLLIFWLVTTTMERDNGIAHTLPQKAPPCENCPEVRARNILNIIVNENDQLLVEDKRIEIEELEQYVVDFYTSSDPSYPERVQVTPVKITSMLDSLNMKRAEYDQIADPMAKANALNMVDDYIKEWNKKKDAQALVGDFTAIHKRAVVRLEVNAKTSYETYIAVLDQIKYNIQEFRNKLSSDKFGMSFEEMDKMYKEAELIEDNEVIDELIPKIKAIREVYPLRILEPDAKN